MDFGPSASMYRSLAWTPPACVVPPEPVAHLRQVAPVLLGRSRERVRARRVAPADRVGRRPLV